MGFDIIIYQQGQMQNNYDGASFFVTSTFNFSNSGNLVFQINLDDSLLFFGIKSMYKLLADQSPFDFNLTYPGGNQLEATLGSQQNV